MEFRTLVEMAGDTMRAVPSSKIEILLTERGPLARIRVADPHLSIDTQWSWHETKIPGKMERDLRQNLNLVLRIAEPA